jgi:hypothetical protein
MTRANREMPSLIFSGLAYEKFSRIELDLQPPG